MGAEGVNAGAALVAFAPGAAVLLFLAWQRPHLVVLKFMGAVAWLFAMLALAIIWVAIPPAKEAFGWVVIMATLVQEGARVLLVRGYFIFERHIEKRFSPNDDRLPLNDFVAALACGSGFATMHALMQFGPVVASTGKKATYFADSCTDAPLVLVLGYTALLFWLLDVALMFAAFGALRRSASGAWPRVAVLVLAHLAMSLTTLANLSDDGCKVSLPLLTVEVVGVMAYIVSCVRIFMPPRILSGVGMVREPVEPEPMVGTSEVEIPQINSSAATA